MKKCHNKIRYIVIWLLLICIHLLVLEQATASFSVARYKIDTGQSQFIVRTFSGGLFSAFGHNHTIAVRDFKGDAQFAPEAPNTASLQMTVKADSLAVTDKENTK